MVDLDQTMAMLTRGCDGVFAPEELKRKLQSGRPLRIKLGMDPTAPDIHLGHVVVLRLMRRFQDLGHKAILLIGDYTAKIGDPTGRDHTRPILDDAAIAANARTYLEQAGKVLDSDPARLEVRRNSEWLAKLTFADVLRLTGQLTVQQMLHRENFKNRMDKGVEIMLSEFMYPLMQAYDSVALNADVELGGTDQTFNNLMGRHLMERNGLEKQVVMVTPLLVGLDGKEKMSKSKKNYIGVNDPPEQMFGKVMSIPDSLMRNYFELLTGLPQPQIESLMNPEHNHPRHSKEVLGRVIVEMFHGRDAGNAAAEEFKRRFSEGQLPADLKTIAVGASPQPLLNVIMSAGFAPSRSEARRLIASGAVSVDGEKITDEKANVATESEPVLKVGKLRVCRIKA